MESRKQPVEDALSSVSGNVDTARQRLTFADESITAGRGLISKPATDQTQLVDAVRATEGALGQAQTLLDAVDSAATDINRAVADLPNRIADIQTGIDQAARPATIQRKTGAGNAPGAHQAAPP